MYWRIYELVQPDVLRDIDNSGYQSSVIYRDVLQEAKCTWSFDRDYPTMEAALAAIEKHKDNLKGKTLTILPIIVITYDGEIREA